MSRVDDAIKKAAELRSEVQGSKERQEPVQPTATLSNGSLPEDASLDEALRTASLQVDEVLGEPEGEYPQYSPTVKSDMQDEVVAGAQVVGSQLNEVYRKLKSLILRLSQKDGHHKNVFLVSSALRGEGKSVTSLNLAYAMAQDYDHKVLLIDADMRSPSVHRYLGINVTVGFEHCLRGEVDVADAIIRTENPNLSIIPSKGNVVDPVELLSSKTLNATLGEMKNRYPDRYLIIDTPPILPFADSQVIASQADAIILVVRQGYAQVEQIQQAIEALPHEKLLGTVFNGSAASRPFDTDYNYRYAKR